MSYLAYNGHRMNEGYLVLRDGRQVRSSSAATHADDCPCHTSQDAEQWAATSEFEPETED